VQWTIHLNCQRNPESTRFSTSSDFCQVSFPLAKISLVTHPSPLWPTNHANHVNHTIYLLFFQTTWKTPPFWVRGMVGLGLTNREQVKNCNRSDCLAIPLEIPVQQTCYISSKSAITGKSPRCSYTSVSSPQGVHNTSVTDHWGVNTPHWLLTKVRCVNTSVMQSPRCINTVWWWLTKLVHWKSSHICDCITEVLINLCDCSQCQP
jgi:hypothetical protein